MTNATKLTLGTKPIIAGVCDGLGQQLTTRVSLIRLGFVVSLLFGFGLFAYLLLYLFMPRYQSAGDIRRKKLLKKIK